MLLTPAIGLRKDLKLKAAGPVSHGRAKELLLAFEGHGEGASLVLDVVDKVRASFTKGMVEMLLLAFGDAPDEAMLEVEVREFGVWVVVPFGDDYYHRQFIGDASSFSPERGRIH